MVEVTENLFLFEPFYDDAIGERNETQFCWYGLHFHHFYNKQLFFAGTGHTRPYSSAGGNNDPSSAGPFSNKKNTGSVCAFNPPEIFMPCLPSRLG